jgi:hypothetical protein
VHRANLVGAVIAALAVLSLSSTAAAAEPRTHEGFQFRGTVGLGYISDAESSNATLHGGAGTLEVYLGGMPIPGLAIGGFLSGEEAIGPSVSVNGLTASSNDTTLTLLQIGPYIDYYSNPHKGFHIMGTIGFARLTARYDDGNFNASDSGDGFALGGGIGYDWWVGREWTVGILGRFTFASTERTLDGGVSVSERTFAPAVLFSVSFH